LEGIGGLLRGRESELRVGRVVEKGKVEDKELGYVPVDIVSKLVKQAAGVSPSFSADPSSIASVATHTVS